MLTSKLFTTVSRKNLGFTSDHNFLRFIKLKRNSKSTCHSWCDKNV